VDDLEEEPPTEPITVGVKLMYTEEQWLARQKHKKKGGDGSGSSRSSKEPRRRPRGGRKQKPKGDRGGGGQGGKAGGAGGERKANRYGTCLNCHRADHWAMDCPQPRRERGGAAHLVEADDDEAALFLAHGFLELETEDILCSKADANLDIDEPRARAFLNTGSGEHKLDGWYLDSGASHHMTGRR